MSATTDRVGSLVAPLLEGLGLRLYDVEKPGATLRVLVDRDDGVDLDALTEATREISRALDEAEPLAGSYTLDVSSPGLERPLRREEHYRAAIGETVRVKLFPGGEGDRRCEGELLACGDDSFTIGTAVGERSIDYADVSKAHTVFEWESAGNEQKSTTESTSDSGRNPR